MWKNLRKPKLKCEGWVGNETEEWRYCCSLNFEWCNRQRDSEEWRYSCSLNGAIGKGIHRGMEVLLLSGGIAALWMEGFRKIYRAETPLSVFSPPTWGHHMSKQRGKKENLFFFTRNHSNQLKSVIYHYVASMGVTCVFLSIFQASYFSTWAPTIIDSWQLAKFSCPCFYCTA